MWTPTATPSGRSSWKILENVSPTDVHDWEDQSGGRVPPFFKLRDCRNCVSGAAYGKSRHSYSYGLDQVKLICTNKSCYQRKLAGDEAAHREKVEAQLLGIDRQDGKSIKTLMGRMALLSYGDLRACLRSFED